jgi:hypothetical protein
MHAVPWLMVLLAYLTLASPETHPTFGEQVLLTIIDKLFIGLLILGAGFYLNRLLETWKSAEELRRQHEALRDQTALRYLERQIDELYSPLLGLIQYSNVVFRIARKKVPEGSQSPEQADVWRYFVEKYFLPLNSQMANLIRTKVSLLESDELPQSFREFLHHQAQFECLHTLWKDKNIRSDEISGGGWPAQFGDDVQASLNQLRRRHNQYRSALIPSHSGEDQNK